MITITCTSCQTTLEIDDAFAGGVCRCRHCGTIQTVPSMSRRPTRPGSPVDPTAAPHAAPAQAPRAVYTTQHAASLAEQPNAAPQRGTGLDELAQVIASSGLTGTGLSSGRLRQGHAAPASPPHARSISLPLIAGGAAILVVIGVVVGFLLTLGSDKPADNPKPAPENPVQVNPNPPKTNADPKNQVTPPVARTPEFLGVKLQGPSVVYLIDRGSGTLPVFDLLREATRKSVGSLKPGMKFQVVYWETNEILRYPKSGLAQASEQEAKATAAFMEDVFAHGATKIEKPLEQALSLNPAEIIIATGKDGLDDAFVKAVMDRRKSSKSRIHTFALGNTASDAPLKKIAQQTGGEFRKIPTADLQRMSIE